jgi:Ca2+:H+ antiporter
LLVNLLPLLVLSKQIAVPINHAVHTLHAPTALSGLLVSVLVLSPESLERRARSAREPAAALGEHPARVGARRASA